MRLRELSGDEPVVRRRQRAKFHPMMIMEIAERLSLGPEDPTVLLFAASHFKDDIPWLYELTIDTYKSIKSENIKDARKNVKQLREALKLFFTGPLIETLHADRRDYHLLLDMMMSILDKFEFRRLTSAWTK